MSNNNRQSKGIPIGGQYAAHKHDDDQLDLAVAAAESLSSAALVAAAHEAQELEEIDWRSNQELLEDEALDRLGITRDKVKTIIANGTATKITLLAPHAKGGYDEIREVNNGAISYLRDGQLHRLDGYALDWRTSNSDPNDVEAYVNGDRIYPPDDTGFSFQNAVEIDKFGTPITRAYWRSQGSRSAFVISTGEKRFYYDGELDRDGAPAVTLPDGTEAWFRYGKPIANPIPDAPHEIPVGTNARGYNQFVGSRHVDGQDVVDIAKQLREDFKHAKYAGMLPSSASIKVTVSRASQSQSVNIAVTGVHKVHYLNPKRDEPGQPWRSDEGQKMFDYIESVGASYNRWQEGVEATNSARDFFLNTSIQTETR